MVRSPYLAIAIGLAGLLFVPNLLWLMHHGFPFLVFEKHARQSGSPILREPSALLLDHARITNPLLAPLPGLVWFFTQGGKALRSLGIAALFVVVLLLGLKAKNEYLSPVYPFLPASGAVFFGPALGAAVLAAGNLPVLHSAFRVRTGTPG